MSWWLVLAGVAVWLLVMICVVSFVVLAGRSDDLSPVESRCDEDPLDELARGAEARERAGRERR